LLWNWGWEISVASDCEEVAQRLAFMADVERDHTDHPGDASAEAERAADQKS
jgi:hypothetical protein